LESGEFLYLRFNEELRNKRGKVPKVEILVGEHTVKARRVEKLEFSFGADDFAKINEYLSRSGKGEIRIPVSGSPPNDTLISRWLAKIGLEMLAHKWLGLDNWNQYIVEHTGLDPVRLYARAPKRRECWGYSKRRIYNSDQKTLAPDGQQGQMIY